MSESHAKVLCGVCAAPLDEPIGIHPTLRSPCPRCGSTSRKFIKDDLGGELTPIGGLKARGFRAAVSKWFVEVFQGPDFSIRLQRWMRKLRIIDRDRDRYIETVDDPATGERIHDADEPLSSHTGHGSDRKR